MNAREVRLALDRLKEIVTQKEFAKLSNEQKAHLCQMIHADADEVQIALTVEAIDRPLVAQIKKRRGTFFKRKFYLDGVLTDAPVNRFDTSEQAKEFATARGIQICEQ
jgi:hypothetical protein